MLFVQEKVVIYSTVVNENTFEILIRLKKIDKLQIKEPCI